MIRTESIINNSDVLL